MVRHDLLGSLILKLAFPKRSHGLQHKAHRRMLSCPRRDGGNAKKKKNLFTKQRKFHQVKVTSPFLLNKIMVTSTTK